MTAETRCPSWELEHRLSGEGTKPSTPHPARICHLPGVLVATGQRGKAFVFPRALPTGEASTAPQPFPAPLLSAAPGTLGLHRGLLQVPASPGGAEGDETRSFFLLSRQPQGRAQHHRNHENVRMGITPSPISPIPGGISTPGTILWAETPPQIWGWRASMPNLLKFCSPA